LTRRRPEFKSGEADAEAAQLNKLCDAGRFKGSGKPTPSKFQVSAIRSIDMHNDIDLT
jgi:hypothetical protein